MELAVSACAGTGNLIWATLGSLLFPLYKRYAQVINTVMALLLVWCAWKIVKPNTKCRPRGHSLWDGILSAWAIPGSPAIKL